MAIEDVQQSVREGESMAKPLSTHAVFPPMVVQMLAVGEETGQVDTMLEKVASFYDAEVEAQVDALTSLIEPLLIAVIGGAVGAAVVALYMPMFNIIKLIPSTGPSDRGRGSIGPSRARGPVRYPENAVSTQLGGFPGNPRDRASAGAGHDRNLHGTHTDGVCMLTERRRRQNAQGILEARS